MFLNRDLELLVRGYRAGKHSLVELVKFYEECTNPPVLNNFRKLIGSEIPAKGFLEATDNTGKTIMHWAAIGGDPDTILKLCRGVEGELDLKFCIDSSGNTVLHYAAGGNLIYLTSYLADMLKDRPDLLFLANQNGQTVLEIIKSKNDSTYTDLINQLEVVQALSTQHSPPEPIAEISKPQPPYIN